MASWVEHTALNDIRVWKFDTTLLCILFFEVANHQIRLTKEWKRFHAIHQSKRPMIYNCYNILGYHTVGYLQTYWNWRHVNEADCCNICAVTAEWRPLPLPTLSAVNVIHRVIKGKITRVLLKFTKDSSRIRLLHEK